MQRRSPLLAELVALLAWWGYCALALRALEPQALSFLALLVAAHQLARVLLEFGTTPTLELRLERSPEKERELIGLGLGLRVRVLLLLLPAVGVWALLEEGRDERLVLALFALALLREPARVFAPSLSLRGSSAEGALPRLASRLVLLALAVSMHYGQAPALAWSAAYCLSCQLEALLERRLAAQLLGYLPRARLRAAGLWELASSLRACTAVFLLLVIHDLARGRASGSLASGWLLCAPLSAALPWCWERARAFAHSLSEQRERFDGLASNGSSLVLGASTLAGAFLMVRARELGTLAGLAPPEAQALADWAPLLWLMLLVSWLSTLVAALEATRSIAQAALFALLAKGLATTGPLRDAAPQHASCVALTILLALLLAALVRRRGPAALPRRAPVMLAPGALVFLLARTLDWPPIPSLLATGVLVGMGLLLLALGRPARELLPALRGTR